LGLDFIGRSAKFCPLTHTHPLRRRPAFAGHVAFGRLIMVFTGLKMSLRYFAAFFAVICFALMASAQNSNSSSSGNTLTSSTPAPAPTPDAAASAKAKAASGAAATVEQSLTGYGALVLNASRYQKAITDITGSTSVRPQAPIEDLRTIQATVVAIQQTDILNSITKAVTALTKDDADRDTKCSTLPQDSTQQDVVDAQKACSQAKSDAAAQSKALSDQLASLKTALQTVYSYVANQIGNYLPKLDSAAAMTKTADASELLQKLAPALVAMRGVLANYSEYQSTWNSLQPTLKGLGIDPPGPDSTGKTPLAPGDQLTAVKTKVNTVLPNVVTWLGTLKAFLDKAAGTLDSQLTPVGTDPAKNNATALQAISDNASDLASAESIVSAWPPLVGFLTDGDPADFHLKDAKKGFNDVRRAVESLRTSSARLQDAIAGDASNFETAQVSLYYFFNVQQLMEALNGNVRSVGGVAEAQQAAAEQRKSLTAAELDLADAQATVNKFQKQVLDLQEQQRQLRAKLKGQDSALSKLSSRLQNAQDAKKGADDDVAAAQSDLNASPNDAGKSAALESAKRKQSTDASKLSQSQSDYDSAKADRDNTQAQLDGTQNQSDSLPAKITAAQQALSESQTAVSQQRRRMIQSAQAESDAFAFARDNTPFLFAPADAANPDPAKRVMLYAYVDSKTIFMRGKRDDINAVKRIISEFDKPAPQARLTLWTFELSADSEQKTNSKAAKKLNSAMEIVDEELGDTRALENTTLALLRDLINEQVKLHTKCSFSNCGNSDDAKLARVAGFYDPAVLVQLQFNPMILDHVRRLVPDPAGSTTLGEALLVLSLATPEIKLAVRDKLEATLPGLLSQLPIQQNSWVRGSGSNQRDRNQSRLRSHAQYPEMENAEDSPRLLPLIWHALGIWNNNIIPPTQGLSSSQLEITRALRAAYDSRQLRDLMDNQIGTLVDLFHEYSSLESQRDGLVQQITQLEAKGRAALSKEDQQKLVDRGLSTGIKQSLLRTGIGKVGPASLAAYDKSVQDLDKLDAREISLQRTAEKIGAKLALYGANPGDIAAALKELAGKSDVEIKKKLTSLLGSVQAATQEQINGLNSATPRVAAADEMLKSLIIALEDDLSRDFVQPMIKRLRIRLMSEAAVRVGVVQRESICIYQFSLAHLLPCSRTPASHPSFPMPRM
jgi:hypothetical protein